MADHRWIAAVTGAWIAVALGTASAQAAGLGGTWSGQVKQNDPPATFPVEMQLSGDTGKIDYASLGCGGTLAFLRSDGAHHWYREHISYGRDRCIDGGQIEMQVPSGRQRIRRLDMERRRRFGPGRASQRRRQMSCRRRTATRAARRHFRL